MKNGIDEWKEFGVSLKNVIDRKKKHKKSIRWMALFPLVSILYIESIVNSSNLIT